METIRHSISRSSICKKIMQPTLYIKTMVYMFNV